MLIGELILAADVVVLALLGAYAYMLYITSQRFVRVVVGRALHARGVPKRRALELIAPELQREFKRWLGRSGA